MIFPRDDLDMVLALTPEFWLRFGGARVLVTGGTGFIGTWLLACLQHANDTLGAKISLVVLSRDPERALRQQPSIFNRRDIKLVSGDVNSFRRSIGRLDVCIHAATDVSDPGKATDQLSIFNTIVFGTQRIIDLAQANGVTRFLLTSTGAVYGTQPANIARISETYGGAPDPLQSNLAYANGKRAAEWLASAYAARALGGGFESLIARIFALVGPGLPLGGSFAAGNFVRDALTTHVINVKGDGSPQRSYLYMADLCVWLLRLLSVGTSGQAYNVGSEHALSIASLAEQIADLAGTDASVAVQSIARSDAPPPRYVPDTSKARKELGLAEYTPLDVALRKTINWTRQSMQL